MCVCIVNSPSTVTLPCLPLYKSFFILSLLSFILNLLSSLFNPFTLTVLQHIRPGAPSYLHFFYLSLSWTVAHNWIQILSKPQLKDIYWSLTSASLPLDCPKITSWSGAVFQIIPHWTHSKDKSGYVYLFSCISSLCIFMFIFLLWSILATFGLA